MSAVKTAVELNVMDSEIKKLHFVGGQEYERAAIVMHIRNCKAGASAIPAVESYRQSVLRALEAEITQGAHHK